MYVLKWKQDAPERFQVTPELSATILHGIEGLDPHRPVFRADRCYPWKLWHSVLARVDPTSNHIHIHIKTPCNTQANQSQSLRALLAFHFFGTSDPPLTSSKKPCPCRSGRTYGECCFPTIHSRCFKFTGLRNCGLCVNPLHFERGHNSDLEQGRDYPLAPSVLPPCEPCAECKWSPCQFWLAPQVGGYHEDAFRHALSFEPHMMHEINDQLARWREESLTHYLKRCDPSEVDRLTRYSQRHF